MKIFIFLLAAVFSLQFFYINTELYYKNVNSNETLEIYSSQNEADFSNAAALAKSALEKAGFSQKKVKIFIVSSKTEFYIFTYGKKGLKYWVNPLNGKVFVNVISWQNLRAEMPDFPKASPDYEIAKAAAAASFRLSRETLSYMFLDDWRLRGLASYFSSEMPLYSPMEFCSAKKEPEFEEFENTMIMKYMIENMKLKTDAALEENYLRDALIKEARPYICKP